MCDPVSRHPELCSMYSSILYSWPDTGQWGCKSMLSLQLNVNVVLSTPPSQPMMHHHSCHQWHHTLQVLVIANDMPVSFSLRGHPANKPLTSSNWPLSLPSMGLFCLHSPGSLEIEYTEYNINQQDKINSRGRRGGHQEQSWRPRQRERRTSNAWGEESGAGNDAPVDKMDTEENLEGLLSRVLRAGGD